MHFTSYTKNQLAGRNGYETKWTRELLHRKYELSDHLGSVRGVVSDRKLSNGEADLLAVNNYYSFGGPQVGRNFSSSESTYGYNGQQKDDEIKGEGLSYDYGNRMYDPWTCIFHSRDRFADKFPWQSPYSYAGNMPIAAIDMNGDSLYLVVTKITRDAQSGELVYTNTTIQITSEDQLKSIQGAEKAFQTQYGNATLSQVMNDPNHDTYVSQVFAEDLDGTGGLGGFTILNSSAFGENKLFQIDENGTIKGDWSTTYSKVTKIQSEAGKMNGTLWAPGFVNFIGIDLRLQDPSKNTFSIINVNSKDENMKSEIIIHELLHGKYIREGLSPKHHHNKMGLEGGADSSAPLPTLRKQLTDIDKQNQKPNTNDKTPNTK